MSQDIDEIIQVYKAVDQQSPVIQRITQHQLALNAAMNQGAKQSMSTATAVLAGGGGNGPPGWRPGPPPVASGGGGSSPGSATATMALMGAPEIGMVIDVFQAAKTAVDTLVGGLQSLASGLAEVGKNSMVMAADFEALVMALNVFSPSLDETYRRVARLRELSKQPGLNFFDTLQASAKLQAAGADFRMAERVVRSFGNALAIAGGDAHRMDLVMLAVTQIATKGKLMGQELRQLAEHVPQIRKLMLQAFGTANSEEIGKMGISGRQFLEKILNLMEEMPRATNTAKNFFVNLADTFKVAMVNIGTALNDTLLPILEKGQKFIDYLSDSGTLANVFKNLAHAFDGTYWTDIAFKLTGGGGNSLLGKTSGTGGALNAKATEVDPGGFLVNLLAHAVAVLEVLPDILHNIVQTVVDMASGFTAGFNLLYGALVDVSNVGISIHNAVVDLAHALNPLSNFFMHRLPAMSKNPIENLFGQNEATTKAWRDLIYDINNRAGMIKYKFDVLGNKTGKTGVLEDKSKGGWTFSDSLDEIAKNTKETADNTRKTLDITRHAFGGGDIGRFGLTAEERQQAAFHGQRRTGGSVGRGHHATQDLAELLTSLIHEAYWSGVASTKRSGSYAGG